MQATSVVCGPRESRDNSGQRENKGASEAPSTRAHDCGASWPVGVGSCRKKGSESGVIWYGRDWPGVKVHHVVPRGHTKAIEAIRNMAESVRRRLETPESVTNYHIVCDYAWIKLQTISVGTKYHKYGRQVTKLITSHKKGQHIARLLVIWTGSQ